VRASEAQEERPSKRKRRGPHSAAGKARSSRNALRHGLTATVHRDPALTTEIERNAKAMCGDDDDPLLIEQAMAIAGCDLLLRCVRVQRVAVVERLWDAAAVALEKGDTSLERAKAKAEEMHAALEDRDQIRARHPSDPEQRRASVPDDVDQWPFDAGLEHVPPQSGWEPPPFKTRDETEMFFEAAPDLLRLARYERRAWSRRKRALRRFMAIKFCSGQHRDRRAE